jgi:phenylalanyl-tRNA synthetase beta chain
VDVIEDILRIYGYNNIEIGEKLQSTLSYVQKPDSSELQKLISEQLTAQGFNEILNNSLTKSSYYANLQSLPEANCARIMNPLSSDLNVMRQSLIFGGLESIVRNSNRKRADLKFYEFGNCYFYHNENRTTENTLSAYSEEYHLSLWLTGNKNSQSWIISETKSSIFELKAYVENILRRLGFDLRKLVYGDCSDDLLSEAMTIYTASGKKMAVFGIIQPKILKTMDIDAEVFYADFWWNNLLTEMKGHKTLFREMSKFPEVKRDLALLIDKNVQFSEIEKIAYNSERNFLKNVYLFDVYEGKTLEAGKKSYAVSFILQDENKTLTDKQIDAMMKKIQTNLENKLGAKLR